MEEVNFETIKKDFNELKRKHAVLALNNNVLLELEGIGDHHILCKANDHLLYYIYQSTLPNMVTLTSICDSVTTEFLDVFVIMDLDSEIVDLDSETVALDSEIVTLDLDPKTDPLFLSAEN